MANFKDLSSLISEDNKELKVPEKVEKKAMDLVMQAKSLLDSEGVDGADFISSRLGMEEEPEEIKEEPKDNDKDRKKALLIIALKKKKK